MVDWDFQEKVRLSIFVQVLYAVVFRSVSRLIFDLLLHTFGSGSCFRFSPFSLTHRSLFRVILPLIVRFVSLFPLPRIFPFVSHFGCRFLFLAGSFFFVRFVPAISQF